MKTLDPSILMSKARRLEILRDYVASRSTDTTCPDMASEDHILKVMKLAVEEFASHVNVEIARLERELENERARDVHSCGPNCTRDGCVNRRLREENETLRKDADRYRWLRENDFETEGILQINWHTRDYEHLIQDDLDAAIDAAIKGQ